MGNLARLLNFYNTRHTTEPAARNCVSSDLRQLTKVALEDVEVRGVSALHDFHLRVDASVNDPIYMLMPAEIRADRGMKVEFAFSMGTARTIGPPEVNSRVPASMMWDTTSGYCRPKALIVKGGAGGPECARNSCVAS